MKEKKFTANEIMELLQSVTNGDVSLSSNKYTLNEIYTISEASDLYNININTIKSKFKPSLVGQDRINEWINDGLIRQSGATWLLTKEFIENNFRI